MTQVNESGLQLDINNLTEEELYEQWYGENEEAIYIELAESGADREMDFDPEKEFDKRYEAYLVSLQA